VRRGETSVSYTGSRSLRFSARSLARSKLRAGSQKLPVLVESAWSWIILPKGIFIGRECMQKRGHRHKGAAPADLALAQLGEWTHGFKPASGPPYPPGLDRTRRNGLPNFPSCAYAAPSFLVPSLCSPSVSPPRVAYARIHFIDTFY